MIGVSSGCQLAMTICLLFLPQHYYLKPLYGFIGGCLALVIIYLLSYHLGFQPVRILLIGVALYYFFNSLLDIFSSTGINNVSVNALLGSQISSQTWNDVLQVGIYLFSLLLLTSFIYKTCDLFSGNVSKCECHPSRNDFFYWFAYSSYGACIGRIKTSTSICS